MTTRTAAWRACKSAEQTNKGSKTGFAGYLSRDLEAEEESSKKKRQLQVQKLHIKEGHHHRTGTEAVGAGGALGKALGTATGTSSSDASLTNSATGADAGASDHASASAAPGERADASHSCR